MSVKKPLPPRHPILLVLGLPPYGPPKKPEGA